MSSETPKPFAPPRLADGAAATPPTPSASGCTLPQPVQTRNLLLFALNTSLIYLAAPVLYVGLTQASLCEHLHTTNWVANLPQVAFTLCTVMPIFLAWLFPRARQLRYVICAGFSASGAMSLLLALTLLVGAPRWLLIALLILQGGMVGASITPAVALMWEVLGRGVSASRRGVALSLGFGLGPSLAVIGSLISQGMIKGNVFGWEVQHPQYPWNFALVFATTVPIMAVAAIASLRFVIPILDDDAPREPFVSGVFGGIVEILSRPVLLRATIATMLVYMGSFVMTNVGLYTIVATGYPSEDFVGYQNAFRFSFKVVAGLCLGMLLTRFSPRSGMLITAVLNLLAVAWVMSIDGYPFLVCFGLFGAGELYGVYGPNYFLASSPPEQMRRNMSFVGMLLVPAAPAALLFGAITDSLKKDYGPNTAYQVSFALAGAMLLVATLLLLTLPARPRGGEPNARE